jgi:predicted dehydrogenase
MTTSKTIRMAVVGCGYWGINHVRVVFEMPETELVAVCDSDVKRLREIKERYPNVSIFSDVRTMIDAVGGTIDAAIVATTATQHYQVARPLLEAGKHVLIEKPITTDVAEAFELVRLANEANVRLMVGHIFLFNSGIEKVKFYVTLGELGQIHYLYAHRTNLGPVRTDVNALWDLATHDIAIFNYLLDQTPLWVSAVGSKVLHSSHEDVGFIVLGYPNGLLGQIHASWVDPHKVRELVVVGSNQRIAFNDMDPVQKVNVFEKGIGFIPHEPASFGEYELSIRDGDIISPHIKINEPLKSQLKHFIDSILNNTRPLSDGLFGAEIVQVMHAVDQSVAQNGSPVMLSDLPVEVG